MKQRLGALRVWVNCNVIYFCLQNLWSWMYCFYSSGLLLCYWPYALMDLFISRSWYGQSWSHTHSISISAQQFSRSCCCHCCFCFSLKGKYFSVIEKAERSDSLKNLMIAYKVNLKGFYTLTCENLKKMRNKGKFGLNELYGSLAGIRILND